MQNPEALKKRLQFYISCYENPGVGLYAMFWKETNEMIGWSGLQPLEDSGEIEVSYGMIKKYWGMGIGLETASMLKYGFESVGLDKIVAVADERNVGSGKIMEKLGMTFENKVEHYGMDCLCYAISRE